MFIFFFLFSLKSAAVVVLDKLSEHLIKEDGVLTCNGCLCIIGFYNVIDGQIIATLCRFEETVRTIHHRFEAIDKEIASMVPYYFHFRRYGKNFKVLSPSNLDNLYAKKKIGHISYDQYFPKTPVASPVPESNSDSIECISKIVPVKKLNLKSGKTGKVGESKKVIVRNSITGASTLTDEPIIKFRALRPSLATAIESSPKNDLAGIINSINNITPYPEPCSDFVEKNSLSESNTNDSSLTNDLVTALQVLNATPEEPEAIFIPIHSTEITSIGLATSLKTAESVAGPSGVQTRNRTRLSKETGPDDGEPPKKRPIYQPAPVDLNEFQEADKAISDFIEKLDVYDFNDSPDTNDPYMTDPLRIDGPVIRSSSAWSADTVEFGMEDFMSEERYIDPFSAPRTPYGELLEELDVLLKDLS